MDIVIITGIIITILTAIPVIIQMKDHPKGLIICFMAEMWERFSYYGMRSLLIYYLTTHFLFSDNRANEQYASYTTLVYLLPLVGGILADRYLGTRKAIIFGALLLVAGHFSMALEGVPNQQTLAYKGQTYEFVHKDKSENGDLLLKIGDKSYTYKAGADKSIEIIDLPKNSQIPNNLKAGEYELGIKSQTPWAEKVFYFAIAFIIMGVGFLKPNISSIVGQLYRDKDPRRDAGFQLYYFGINLGAFWATILCGALGQRVGWWAGFGLAGVGMLAGLLFFILGQPLLDGKGLPPDANKLKQKFAGLISIENLIYLCGLLGVPLIYFFVQKNQLVGWGLGLGSLAVVAYVIFNMVTKLNKIENYRLGLAIILTLSSIVFFTLFEQAGSSLSLFASRNTDMNILSAPISFILFGKQIILASQQQLEALNAVLPNHLWINTQITPAQTQSFNAGFILIFAPIFSAIFTFMGKRGIDPDPVKKFAFGLVNAGIGFLVLVWAAKNADSAFKLPLIFLFLTYLFHTWGELSLSPVGLSQQTKLSPPFLISTMMAIWFLGSSAAQFVAGFIAKLASTETVGGQVLDAKASLETSIETFKLIGNWGIIIGIGLFILSFFVSKWAYGANDSVKE